jgi:hypothetical protein
MKLDIWILSDFGHYAFNRYSSKTDENYSLKFFALNSCWVRANIWIFAHSTFTPFSSILCTFSLFCIQQWEKRKFLFIDVCERWLDLIIFLIISLTWTEIIHVKDWMWTLLTNLYINKRLFPLFHTIINYIVYTTSTSFNLQL